MLADMLQPRLVELGKIKIGGLGEARTNSSGKKWRMPRKDDHFTITTMHRETAQGAQGDLIVDSGLMDELMLDYGDKDGFLRKIPIYLLSDDIEDVMQSSWVCYSGKRIMARSDGKTLTWFGNPKTGDMYQEPKTSTWNAEAAKSFVDQKGNPYFKKHTVLNCVIASKEARWGGVYKFRTTSVISGDQLYGSLLNISKITRGVLVGIPMRIVVRPMLVTPQGKPTTVYVVNCELVGRDMISIQQQALKTIEANFQQARQIEHINLEFKRLIHAPGFESEIEASEVQQEYHPESPEGNGKTEGPPMGDVDLRADEKAEAKRQEAITARADELITMLRQAQSMEEFQHVRADVTVDQELLGPLFDSVVAVANEVHAFWNQELAKRNAADAKAADAKTEDKVEQHSAPGDLEPPDEVPDF